MHGVRLTVEESTQHVFPVHEYAAAGCEIAPQGSWPSLCPAESHVLGIKELPDEPGLLRHRHVSVIGPDTRARPSPFSTGGACRAIRSVGCQVGVLEQASRPVVVSHVGRPFPHGA